MPHEEMSSICKKRRNLADEPRSVRGIIVVGKDTEFVTDTIRKDDAEMAQLRELERQMELRALEKELFIQKLVQNVPYLNVEVEYVVCGMPLLQELARAVDSNDIRDQLSVLFRREVNKDYEKMHDYQRLSNELREGVRMRDAYITELQMFQMSESSNEVVESIEIMKVGKAKESSNCRKHVLSTLVDLKAGECICLALEVYRIQAMVTDIRLAKEINVPCAYLTAVIDERENFMDELNVLAGRRVLEKMAEFIGMVQGKGIPNLMKLQILGREFKLRAQEKDIFIKKLKRNMNF
nr:hypothetical protein [Tanacetum cinerariifolium]